jgi:hypothetical protein
MTRKISAVMGFLEGIEISIENDAHISRDRPPRDKMIAFIKWTGFSHHSLNL